MHNNTTLVQDSDESFGALFDEHESIMLLIDSSTGTIRNANQAAAHFYGYARAELCTMSVEQVCTTEPEQLTLMCRQALRKEQNRFVLVHQVASGEQRTVEVYVSPVTLDGQLVLFAIIHDITERVHAEQALRQSELLYRTLINTLDVSVCRWLPDTTLVFTNEQYRTIFGITGNPIGRQWLEFLPEATRTETAAFYRTLALNPGTVTYEHPVQVENGQVRHYQWIDTPIFDADNHLLEFQSVGVDITERKRAEEALRELNQTLEQRVRQRTAEVQDLYENAPIGYHALDANGTIVMVNQTQLDWLGYRREELIGRSAASFLSPASIALFIEQFQVFKECGRARDLEFEMIRKDGAMIPILLSATAVYDEYGQYVMSRSAVFDNTLRKQAETALRESEEQNRLLFEESPDAVVLFRADGTLVQLNRAFEQLTGYSATQLLGQTLNSVGLIPRETTRQLDNLVTEHLQASSDVAAIELRLRRANGEFRDIGVRVFGLPIRGHQHYLATMRDITTEKQVEETLRQANAELARAARSKDEFLATMSHELRTPLNAILGLSETLLEQIRGPLNEYQQDAVRNIEVSGRHLLALITDILDISKVEAGRLDLQVEAVNVADVCHASLLFVKEQAVKKALRLAFTLNDQMAEMEADPRRLKQMLVNLLSNAVKFTPARGQVRLEVEVDAEAAVVRFAVRDTGVGIAPEDLGRLFQPFKQLDSRLSRQHEGTGLGLALVRRLAELHGGSITVESTPNQGSCFTISLPYHLPPPINIELPAQAADLDSSANLLQSALVVEDSESAAEQLARYLHEASVRVFVHNQGVGALEQAIRLQPTVIFLDLLMPDRSGWEVLAQLKSNPRTRAIPVVIVSVIDDQSYGLAAGALAYLVKPVTRETLRRVLSGVASAITAEAQQALVIVPQQAPPSPSGTRILLVEDNEVNLLTVSAYLQARGYSLSIARNGLEALNLVDEIQPELILMDIQMPEMDGLEATRRLRARPAYAQVPIIALTALVMPGDRERCLQAGANAYLTKPVSLRGLADTIEELLHRRGDP